MPTYAQLQAESWWGREIVTPEIDWFGDELCRRTGRPRAAFGSKGDNHHLAGAHRSQEWILKSRYCTNRGYTIQSGLTATQARHIAGIDFTPGSAAEMVAQCKRIYAAMRAGRLEEVREFYGNVDGDQVVDGWDNVRNRKASSDSSHLWHWHLSIDRRHCADRALMERILAIVLGDTVEDDDMALSAEGKQAVREAWTEGAYDAFHAMLTGKDYNGTEAKTALALRAKMGDVLVPIVREAVAPLEKRLAALEARPPVQAAPVDAAAVAAALAANTTFLAALAKAVNDDAAARMKS